VLLLKILKLLNDFMNTPSSAPSQWRSRDSKTKAKGRQAHKEAAAHRQASWIDEEDTRRDADVKTNIGRRGVHNEAQRRPSASQKLPKIVSTRGHCHLDVPDPEFYRAERLEFDCSDREHNSQEQPLNAALSSSLSPSQQLPGHMPAEAPTSHYRPPPHIMGERSGFAANYYDGAVSFGDPSLASHAIKNTPDLNTSSSRGSQSCLSYWRMDSRRLTSMK